MEYYKFNGHFRGMGQDEYLSQGTFNYAENIDLYRQNAFFTPSISHVTHGKTTDDGIFRIEELK